MNFQELAPEQKDSIERKVDFRLFKKLEPNPDKLNIYLSIYQDYFRTDLNPEDFPTDQEYKEKYREELLKFEDKQFADQIQRLKNFVPDLPENFPGFGKIELERDLIYSLLSEKDLIGFMSLPRNYPCEICKKCICDCD